MYSTRPHWPATCFPVPPAWLSWRPGAVVSPLLHRAASTDNSYLSLSPTSSLWPNIHYYLRDIFFTKSNGQKQSKLVKDNSFKRQRVCTSQWQIVASFTWIEATAKWAFSSLSLPRPPLCLSPPPPHSVSLPLFYTPLSLSMSACVGMIYTCCRTSKGSMTVYKTASSPPKKNPINKKTTTQHKQTKHNNGTKYQTVTETSKTRSSRQLIRHNSGH